MHFADPDCLLVLLNYHGGRTDRLTEGVTDGPISRPISMLFLRPSWDSYHAFFLQKLDRCMDGPIFVAFGRTNGRMEQTHMIERDRRDTGYKGYMT